VEDDQRLQDVVVDPGPGRGRLQVRVERHRIGGPDDGQRPAPLLGDGRRVPGHRQGEGSETDGHRGDTSGGEPPEAGHRLTPARSGEGRGSRAAAGSPYLSAWARWARGVAGPPASTPCRAPAAPLRSDDDTTRVPTPTEKGAPVSTKPARKVFGGTTP